MRQVMREACVLIGFLGLSGASQAAPIKILRGAGSIYTVPPERVLYQEDDIVIVSEADASFTDFDDLYVVNMSHRNTWPDDIDAFGNLVHFEPSRFALMTIKSTKVEELAGRLHGEGLACGVLLKLSGNGIQPLSAATPAPILAVTQKDAQVDSLASAVSRERIEAAISDLAAIPTRFHGAPTGKGVADYLLGRYRALQGRRTDVSLSTYDHGRSTAQRSLIVRLEGKTKPDEVIILGSHLDSVNWQDGTTRRSPGADDNASGTATNLEIFRVLMEHNIKLERTLEIHAYAAEEIGLIGSQDIARNYRSRGINVIAMMQIDMDLYKDPTEDEKIWFVTNNTNDAFNSALGSLVDHYAGVAWAKRSLSGGSSDHAAWHREGFSAAFPFENPRNHNPHIHSADDTISNSGDLVLASAFAKLGVAYATHFGGIIR